MVRPGRSALGVVVVIDFSRGHEGNEEAQFNSTRWDWTPEACRKGKWY